MSNLCFAKIQENKNSMAHLNEDIAEECSLQRKLRTFYQGVSAGQSTAYDKSYSTKLHLVIYNILFLCYYILASYNFNVRIGREITLWEQFKEKNSQSYEIFIRRRVRSSLESRNFQKYINPKENHYEMGIFKRRRI